MADKAKRGCSRGAIANLLLLFALKGIKAVEQLHKVELLHYAAFLDASLLTGEVTQVIKLGATNLAVLVDSDRVDKRRLDGEDTLHADIVAHLANGETLLVTLTGDADYNSTELLDTFLVTFFDAVSNGDGVARAEGLEFFLLSGKCLFGYFD